jgi:predicted O-methyltransferase YrrM
MSDDPILRPEQAEYLHRLLPPRDELLAEMEDYAAEHDVPISVPEVGRLLEVLAASVGAGQILEVGTAIGYSALRMARAAPAGRVVTLDRDRSRLELARDYLARGGVLDRVELVEGEALELLPRLQGPFAMAYLDGDKSLYLRCLDQLLPRLAVGGLLVIDNLLWKGRVADPPAEDDPTADALASFNGYLMGHPQLSAVVLPLGDGVGVASKRRQLLSELGGPF